MEDQKPAVSSLETLNTPASEMEDPPCPGVRIKTEPVEEETAYSSALDPAAMTLAEGTNTREVTASHASHGGTQRTNLESQEYELCEQPGAAGSHSDGGLLVDVKLETNVESRGCELDENTEARQSENPSDSGPVVDVKQEANLEGSQLNENTAAGQSAKQWESGFVADVKQERNVENERSELTEDTPPAGQPQAEGELVVRIKQEKIDSSEVAGGDVPADDSTVVMRGDDFVVERVHSDGEGNEDCKHSSNLRAHASTPKTDTRGRSFPSNIAGPSRSGGARSGITALPSGGESIVDENEEVTEDSSMQSASSDIDETLEAASPDRTDTSHPVPLKRSRLSGWQVGLHHMAVSHTETMEPASTEQAGTSHPRSSTTRRTDSQTAPQRNHKQPQEACSRSAKERMTLQLVTKDIERVQMEKTKHLLEVELLQNKLHATMGTEAKKLELLNMQISIAKKEQLKLYYEVKKMESQLGLSGEMGVDRIFKPE